MLCKVGDVGPGSGSCTVVVRQEEALQRTAAAMCRLLLTFFVEGDTMRPLTNSNVVLDFDRYLSAPYYQTVRRYLKSRRLEIPDYRQQYTRLLQYYTSTKVLHTYGRFHTEGAVASTPNTKSLQAVRGTEGAVHKLARSDYYKYRAANLMFGFNSNVVADLLCFSEFNALRKNQLLRFYEPLESMIAGTAELLAITKSTKYRDYCAY